MSASTGDLITDTRNSARPVTASVTGIRNAGGTTLLCDALTGWPDTTKSKIHFVTYTVDSNNDPVAGTQLDCSGIVSGSSITSLSVIDGNDTGNAVGDKVEMLPTAAWGQDLADALTAEHDRTGLHAAALVTSRTEDTTPASGDFLLTYDISASALKKVQATNLAQIAGLTVPQSLMSGTGTTWAWQSWTPSLTNITIGNGTTSAKYVQSGKTVFYNLAITFGSSTTISGAAQFTLPVTTSANYTTAYSRIIGQASFWDTSASTIFYGAAAWLTSTSVEAVVTRSDTVNLSSAATSSTNPMTWATGDVLHLHGFYEAV